MYNIFTSIAITALTSDQLINTITTHPHMTQDLVKLLRKTQNELQKAYAKINEYDYMIMSTPINDKQLLTRELAHHIKNYEDLVNATQIKPQVSHVSTQTIFIKNDHDTMTDTVEFMDMTTNTVVIETSDHSIMTNMTTTSAHVQVEPQYTHQLVQTTQILEQQPQAQQQQQQLEWTVDVSKYTKESIVYYDIQIN